MSTISVFIASASFLHRDFRGWQFLCSVVCFPLHMCDVFPFSLFSSPSCPDLLCDARIFFYGNPHGEVDDVGSMRCGGTSSCVHQALIHSARQLCILEIYKSTLIYLTTKSKVLAAHDGSQPNLEVAGVYLAMM